MIKKLFRNEFTKNVSVYISLKNEPSWNRKSYKKKYFTDGKTPLKIPFLRS